MRDKSRTEEIAQWCFQHFGDGSLVPLWVDAGGQMSAQFRYSTARRGIMVVKVREESVEKVQRCLQLQGVASRSGFPCANPVTDGEVLHPGFVVSAESWLPGGKMQEGNELAYAGRSAQLLAELVELLDNENPTDLGTPPPWMNWTAAGQGPWPSNPILDAMDQARIPDRVQEIAMAVSERLAETVLPAVIGHGDWESQNLRWVKNRPWAVHDWDSLVALPEAAIVGAASGAFASTDIPTLAPVSSSAEFINRYEQARGRHFTEEEFQVAWAASLWPALHNARGEGLFLSRPVALLALTHQAPERLQRAGLGK